MNRIATGTSSFLQLDLKAVLVSLVIVSTHFYAMDLRLFYMLGLQSFIILVLVILLILNRSRTKREIGNGHLSFRYQMAENINALRIIIPVVVLDALLTFVDILCEKIFSVDVVFESMKCDIRSYFTVFVISQTARVGIEASIPLVVVILHPSLRKAIASKPCGCRSQKGDMERLQLRNVLGEKINSTQSVEQHFSYLQAKWDV
ncbi:hypothetical protein NECAME_00351 [Necator americanus]|uniref:G-protein coupled receptors family 1 profile domain-containing protein n=1 Tax=Necator americanus TaxID=51031 RepID=W2TAU3_NECAM|nr:hypothetical protein NECAME_00351 [Necator americanus]ETN78978.1 hypothetical protein NECAME_00351 [Necator americanus]